MVNSISFLIHYSEYGRDANRAIYLRTLTGTRARGTEGTAVASKLIETTTYLKPWSKEHLKLVRGSRERASVYSQITLPTVYLLHCISLHGLAAARKISGSF